MAIFTRTLFYYSDLAGSRQARSPHTYIGTSPVYRVSIYQLMVNFDESDTFKQYCPGGVKKEAIVHCGYSFVINY